MTPNDQSDTDDIRVKVAEAMGWTEIEMREVMYISGQPAGSDLFGKWPEWPTGHGNGGFVPAFTTDHNAAFTLCDRLKSEGWLFGCNQEPDGSWRASFYNGAFMLTTAPTLPMAICLAFLKVMDAAS